MMRSDMPKQIMAYRNGGGLPSLATVPMEFSNGGGILSKLKSGIASIGSQIKSDIKEIMDNAGKPISEQSQAYREKTEASKKNLELAASRRKKRRRKRRRRAEAAAAAAAEQQTATDTATVDGGITTLTPSVADQNIINMVNERDDLTAIQKLEFAISLGENLGVPDGAGVQYAVDNLSNVALDPTSGLSDADRVSALTSLSPYTGTDYSGLIDTLNNQIAANNLANVNTIATTTPGADIINNVATTPAANTTAMTPAAPATYTGYAPIVPAANVSTAGIAGLPSTDTSTIQPYTFTAFTPDAYTPAVNPLVLPPLG
tara:strand:- start:2074 stop:3024 length:951 start_codon:yes stop_codon:yes gene_type:complete